MKKILSLILVLAVVLGPAGVALAGPAKSCAEKWNADDKNVAANIGWTDNTTRKDASGDKITSNAHSADFPGIYFIWDSKQKDNGYLKVAASVFEKYEYFVLTSKESNKYFDFTVAPEVNQGTTGDGCYVFYIPKVYNNKNINMVFIKYGPKKEQPRTCEVATPIVSKPVNGYVIPSNAASRWNDVIADKGADFTAFEDFGRTSSTVAEFIWDKSEAEPANGDKVVFEFNYEIDCAIVGGTDFTILADNGFVMMINGKVVANSKQIAQLFGYEEGIRGPASDWVTEDGLLTELAAQDLIDDPYGYGDLRFYYPNDWVNEWEEVYTVKWDDIKDLFEIGNNNVTIIAWNTPDHAMCGADTDSAVRSEWCGADHGGTTDNNPAGLIFAGTVFSKE